MSAISKTRNGAILAAAALAASATTSFGMLGGDFPPRGYAHSPSSPHMRENKKTKAKRKIQKESRRRNRRK